VAHRRQLRLTQARRRLLRLRCTSGCIGTSRDSSRGSSSTTSPRAGSSSTTSPTPRVRVPRHAARCQLLHLRHGSGCFGSSRGSSRGSLSTTPPRAGSSSTTSTTTRVRLLRHVARLVAWLVVDYFASAARPGASAHRAARCRLL
jgi:hypothetical protein